MKFLKKPLAILSGAILLAGLILTVVLAVLPHGGTYTGTYTATILGITTERKYEYKFKGGKLYINSYVADKLDEEDKVGLDYYIKGGKLYLMTKEAYKKAVDDANAITNEEAKEAALKALDGTAYKINAFRMTPNVDKDDNENLEAVKEAFGVESPKFTCGVTSALLYVGIALLAVGVIGEVCAVVFISLGKKGSKKAAAK